MGILHLNIFMTNPTNKECGCVCHEKKYELGHSGRCCKTMNGFLDTTDGEAWEKRFFTRMAKVLDEQFPKGEKCKCGDRLRARSHALVLNAWANIYAKDSVNSERQAATEEERESWINQPANEHDERIRQAEREEIIRKYGTFNSRHNKGCGCGGCTTLEEKLKEESI